MAPAMSGLETPVQSNVVQTHEHEPVDTPVWGNDCDPVAGRYASGKQAIGEVLDPLSPGSLSIPIPTSDKQTRTRTHQTA
jgi:hypothetical protein